ncbi:transmembrane protein 116-like isoform X2 [Anneissia japonica]|uniref:transmembrane protein 116-like isoform X2 n=1 Tax=Anneissia japonica TaxID=1529436 RepID=UPI0014256C2A|nr:transmembrane protein 116-like isoform X2 [Anneissia japonica]
MQVFHNDESSPENPNIFRPKQLDVISYIDISTSLLSIFGAGSVVLVALGKRKVRAKDTPCCPSFNMKIFCYVLSWIVPVAVSVALMVVIQEEGHNADIADPCVNYECLLMFHQQNDVCLNQSRLGDEGRIVAKSLFIVPLILAMATILVIYVKTFRLFRRVQISGGVLTKKHHEAVREVRNKGLMYSSAFAFCWIPALALGLTSFSNRVDVQDIYWLVILQSLTATLHGFMNCVIYGWNRTNFTNALRVVKRQKEFIVKYSSYGTLQDSNCDVT